MTPAETLLTRDKKLRALYLSGKSHADIGRAVGTTPRYAATRIWVLRKHGFITSKKRGGRGGGSPKLTLDQVVEAVEKISHGAGPNCEKIVRMFNVLQTQRTKYLKADKERSLKRARSFK